MVSQKQLNSIFILLACAISIATPMAANAQANRARAGARPADGHPAAARPGAPRGPQVSTAQISAYLNRLRGKLINAWMLPDGNNHVTVSGSFNQDGLSDNLRPSSSPKNGPAEDAAMQAFNKCMPLEAMPSGITNAKITIDFTSNADPHGDSKSNISLRLDPIQAPKTESAPAQSQTAPAAAEPAQVQTAAPAAAQVTEMAAPAQTTAPAQTAAPAQTLAPAQTASPDAGATPAQVPSAPATPVAPAADATQLQPGPAGALTEPAK